jgi:hypothetical protein
VIAELAANCLKTQSQRPKAAAVVERLELGCAAALAVGASQNDVDATLCVICMDAPRVMAFVPCGHRCLCVGCSASFVASGADWGAPSAELLPHS